MAGVAAGVGREVGRSLKLALPFALLLATVNALVYQGGRHAARARRRASSGDAGTSRWRRLPRAAIDGPSHRRGDPALGGLMSAAVDPDQLLKALRRVSYRSALTAALATRLVPVLARDAGRMGDAARCRPQPPGAPGGRARGDGELRSTARWTWPPRSRCAATRSPGARARGAPPMVSARSARRRRCARGRGAGDRRGVSRAWARPRPIPTLDVAFGTGRVRPWRRRSCCSALAPLAGRGARMGVRRA